MQCAQRGPPFFQKTDWLSFGATTLLALAVYLLTLAPDVGLEFSGIYSVGAMYAGVEQPPGYPLWTLWAWAFTKLLPFSNIAWRASVATAVAGALTCGVIALMVSRGGAAIIEKIPDNQKLKPKENKWLRAVCGYSAGMVFGLNGAFWPQAVIANVWPLSMLLLCTVLSLLLRWSYNPERRNFLYMAAFVYGLLLTNSQIELAFMPVIPFLAMLGDQKIGRDMFLAGMVLSLFWLIGSFCGSFPSPKDNGAGLFFIYILLSVLAGLVGIVLTIKTRRAFSEWKVILICCTSFSAGLSLCFYLPVASMTNPPINWGYPRTVEGFFHVLSRGQYESIRVTQTAARFFEQFQMYFAVAGKEFGWPYLLIAVIPFCFRQRTAAFARKWILGLLAVYVYLATLMLAVLNPSLDKSSVEISKVYFSASYVVLALLMGYGLVFLAILLTKSPNSRNSSAE